MPRPAACDLPGADPEAFDDPMLPRRFRLVRSWQQTADTYTLELEPADGGPPLRYAAGQFTMLSVFGVGEVPISMSGDALAGGDLQYTIRDVGVITHAICTAPLGTVLGVRGPYGTSWDVTDGEGGDVVLVAGGCGLAPLRPAILELLAHRERYGAVVLLYGARTPADFLFADDITRWETEFGMSVHCGVRAGLTAVLAPGAGFVDPEHTLGLMCGPDVMMERAAVSLVAYGVPPRRVRMSLERNMKCGIGLCGHCQLRELFMCVDGPVVPFDLVSPLLSHTEL
jgi:NAD(P)H-flavin reductase